MRKKVRQRLKKRAIIDFQKKKKIEMKQLGLAFLERSFNGETKTIKLLTKKTQKAYFRFEEELKIGSMHAFYAPTVDRPSFLDWGEVIQNINQCGKSWRKAFRYKHKDKMGWLISAYFTDMDEVWAVFLPDYHNYINGDKMGRILRVVG